MSKVGRIWSWMEESSLKKKIEKRNKKIRLYFSVRSNELFLVKFLRKGHSGGVHCTLLYCTELRTVGGRPFCTYSYDVRSQPAFRSKISNVDVRRMAICFLSARLFPLAFFLAQSSEETVAARCTAKNFFSSLYRRRGTRPTEESHKNLKPCERRRRHDCRKAFASRFDPKRPSGCLSDL